MTTRTATTTLVDVSCYSCGVEYAIPSILEKAAHEKPNDKVIWCPNGHTWWYIGETEAQRLTTRLRNAEADADWYKEQLHEREKSLSATRGVVTKLRKRAHAGTCPFGCRRHFADLERHVASKHPGATLDGEQPDPPVVR